MSYKNITLKPDKRRLPETVATTVRLPVVLAEAVQERARRDHRTVSAVVRLILAEKLQVDVSDLNLGAMG